MKNWKILITFVSLLTLSLGNFYSVNAQQNLAQQAYAIFEQSCLNCHGEHGAYTEAIIIEHTALLKSGAVVPGNRLNPNSINDSSQTISQNGCHCFSRNYRPRRL